MGKQTTLGENKRALRRRGGQYVSFERCLFGCDTDFPLSEKRKFNFTQKGDL